MSDSARDLIARGFTARRERRPQDATTLFGEAAELARATGDRVACVAALKGLGQIERDSGNREAALEHYRNAAEECREVGDPLLLAHTIRHLGEIHLDEGQLGEAEVLLEEALAIYRTAADVDILNLANAVRPVAILRERTGPASDAIRLWEEARDLYRSAQVDPGVAESETRLAALRSSSTGH